MAHSYSSHCTMYHYYNEQSIVEISEFLYDESVFLIDTTFRSERGEFFKYRNECQANKYRFLLHNQSME